MKRRFYIELDEEYIPIFKACGITAPFSDFKEQILCKDCRFWDSDHIGIGLMLCHISDWNAIVRNADDYCSRAKRKEE